MVSETRTTITFAGDSIKSPSESLVPGIATSSIALASTFTEQTSAKSVKHSAVPLILTATSLPEIATVVSPRNSLTAKTSSTVSWPALPAEATMTSNAALRLSAIYVAESTFVETLYHSTSRKSVSLKSRKNNDGIVNGLRNIGLISVIGALIVLLVLAIALYRCVWRNQCFGW